MKVSTDQVLLSCEHGGNRIPAAWRSLFAGKQAILDSHRGWDPGALQCARRIAAELETPLLSSTTSRLLIELNRSLHHRALFSEYSRTLPENDRSNIIKNYYLPYREKLQQTIAGIIRRRGFVLHLSIHSFTPKLNHSIRNADIGLLYDPRRRHERRFAMDLQESLRNLDRNLKIRRNYPYRGIADGVTTYHRKLFKSGQYAGLEIEINQKYPLAGDNRAWCRLQNTIVQGLARSLGKSDIHAV